MKIAISFFSSLVWSLLIFSANAQDDTQEVLFQKYQAMVIIEELNQHCPMLNRLEAVVLNSQIIFDDANFLGKLSKVEAYKREARLYARKVSCVSPDVLGLLKIARQQANDNMINQLFLARQIHLFDLADVKNKKIPLGLILSDLKAEDWTLIEGLYDQVKANYLSRVGQDLWQNFEDSIIKVAEKRTAVTFMSNQMIISSSAKESFPAVQATANNNDISSYYFNLEKSVRAFIEGAKAQETDYPYSRPANDFTNWTAFRPRNNALNWRVSYVGCGGHWQEFDCSLFVSNENEIGIVVTGENSPDKATLIFRNSNDQETYQSLVNLEKDIGTNKADYNDFVKNAVLISTSKDKISFEGTLSNEHDQLGAQSGAEKMDNAKIFIFPKATFQKLAQLKKNDIVKLEFSLKNEKQNDGLMPIDNFHNAINWASSEIIYQ